MIKIIDLPGKKEWGQLAARPSFGSVLLRDSVSEILRAVKSGGDGALLSFTQNIDGVKLDSALVESEEFMGIEQKIDDNLKKAIDVAIGNITRFHVAQKRDDVVVETMEGIFCMQKSFPVKRVGLYIPGGSAPLFSTLLMLAIPAKIAGCNEIVIATPPQKDGRVAPAILYIAKLLCITEIIKAGGAQAIGALAYGTESVRKVSKIFGPGNQFVSEAKQQVSSVVAIDMLAGPSEVMIIADKWANPTFAAWDLLAQAEHGPDSQVFLLTDSQMFANEVALETERLISELPRAAVALKSLENSRIVICPSIEDAFEFSNYYAPEHLIICTRNSRQDSLLVEAAGSVFIGRYSPESVGDYASGTNHTLPTSGWALSTGGVSLDSFLHKITFQELSPDGLISIASTVEIMAEAEGLRGHSGAVAVRREFILNGVDNENI